MKNKAYTGKQLDYIGFPLGGMGAGMFTVEGTGAFSAFSLRNAPNVNLEPCLFSAITVKGEKSISRVIESQVPKHKIYGAATAPLTPKLYEEDFAKCTGLYGRTYGLPRFKNAVFSSRFPFAEICFEDAQFPLTVSLKAWSPFTPPCADDSSYPIAYLEYTFENRQPTPPEAEALITEEGPKYQYGKGCISDGVLGFWLAEVSGLEEMGDSEKIKSHLNSVYRYNLRENLLEHADPQRPGFCLGEEAGLLLCTWPHGEKPALPFVYSDEVWTGIEYQVASHLMFVGEVEKGLDIVRACRNKRGFVLFGAHHSVCCAPFCIPKTTRKASGSKEGESQ